MKEVEIFRELRNVKWKKVIGLGNFFFGLFKDVVEVIIKFLIFIINLFFVIEVVFIKWKVIKVICFFKIGVLVEIDNYRRILIFFILLKVLVRRVYK